MGGYDGSNMISNVEIFDLCTNSWRICSPLQVTMDDNLFYIGGVNDAGETVDTVSLFAVTV